MTIKKFEGIWTAKSPISHGSDEDFGMEERLRALKLETNEKETEEIPVISGNGLRGKLRDLLARHLLDFLDIEISDTLSNVLYAGGTLKRGSGTGKVKRKTIKKVRDKIPMLSVLGTALETQMIEGKVNIGMLIPIAKETETFTGIESDKSVFEFVDELFYTRMDDRLGGRQQDEDKQQMKYVVQVFIPGTKFKHEFVLEHCDKLEKACIFKAFELLNKSPYIGGMKNKGHGKVDFDYEQKLGSSKPYKEFLEENKEDIKSFLKKLDEKIK